MPKRIQRKRTKGWEMPINTVCVTRPGKWGNPFSMSYWIRYGYSREHAQKTVVDLFRECLIGGDTPIDEDYPIRMLIIKRDIAALRGKDLACWCKPGEPCHADILLEIANAK